MDVIRKQLSTVDLWPVSARWNASTGVVQTTSDGGATWVDNPSADPRNQTLQPPPASGNPRCDGAARVVAVLKQLVVGVDDYLTTASDYLTLANLVLQLLAEWLPEVFLLAPFVTTIAGALVTLGHDAIDAAFTTTEWSLVQDAIFCNLKTSGQTDAAGLDAIETDVTALTNTVVGVVINYLLSMMGVAGVNNVAGATTTTGTCDPFDCAECWLNGLGKDNITIRGWTGGSSGAPQGTYDSTNQRYVSVVDPTGIEMRLAIFIPAGTWIGARMTIANVFSGGGFGVTVYPSDSSMSPVYDDNPGTGVVEFMFSAPVTGAPGSHTGAWLSLWTNTLTSPTNVRIDKLCLLAADW